MGATLGALLGLLAGASSAAAATPTARPAPVTSFDPATTYVVVAGVVTWASPDLDGFSPEHRKDIELYDTFVKRGVPASHRALLIDAQATTANIEAAIANVLVTAPADATVVFYYEGHGVLVDDGSIAFASYDIDLEDVESTGLTIDALKLAFAPIRARTTILLGDACYSGALGTVARAISRTGGRQAVALTSATSRNESTGNWTFTQALIDGFSGRALVDLNDDGVIELGELARDTRDAMRHREDQARGYTRYGVSEHLVLATTVGEPQRYGVGSGPLHRRAWVTAVDPDDYAAPAQILAVRDDGNLLVAFYDYSTERQSWVAPDDVEVLR